MTDGATEADAGTAAEGRPFRGVNPKELPDDELLERHQDLQRTVARKRREVERLERELPTREVAGEPAIEELEEARAELERLQAVKRAWRGPAERAQARREEQRNRERLEDARAELPAALDAFVEARDRLRRARQSLRNALATINRDLRDPDLRSAVEPLPRGTAQKLRAAAEADETVAAGVDLDLLPVEGEEDGEEEPSRHVVERPDEVVLVGDWSDEEVRAKRSEHAGKTVRTASVEEVAP